MESFADRAAAYLQAHGGSATSDELTVLLYGGKGSAWRPLLVAAIADERIVRNGDTWTLSGHQNEPTDDRVAVAIETTGQDPYRHRPVLISACRLRNGEPAEAWFSYVNPERRLPGWLADRLGLDEGFADDAPSLKQATDQFRDFLGHATVIGYDLAGDWMLLQTQLKLQLLPPITNPIEDLLPGAANIAGAAKPTLDRVAARLGIPTGRRYREANEARLIARIAAALPSATDLAVGQDRDPMQDAAITAPSLPGVYVFSSTDGEALYVGKAKNLRSRLLAYTRRPAEHDRGLRGLRRLTGDVLLHETEDDLAAILLEYDLLQRLQPRYNTARRTGGSKAYLGLDRSAPFPKLSRRDSVGIDTFGPFPSGRAAGDLVKTAVSVFQLRTCTRKLGPTKRKKPRPPCHLLDDGKCLGPCTGSISPDLYGRRVSGAAALLQGDRRPAIAMLQERMSAASRDQLHAEVARLRVLLRDLTNRWGGDLLSQPFDAANVVALLPRLAPQRVYVVQNGALTIAADLQQLTADTLDSSAEAAASALEKGHLAGRWLKANAAEAVLFPIAADTPNSEIWDRIAPYLDG